jgi:CO/xanthine dehydrogenase Mo-binding subunit
MDGPAPAIINAVEDAIGAPFNSIPLLPEDIFAAISERTASANLASRAGGLE